jgi:hypothetical protein
MAALAILFALQVQVVTTTGGHLPDRDFHITLQTRDSVLEVIANPAPPVIERGAIYHVTPRPSHLFLRQGADTIEPDVIRPFEVRWGNVPGAELDAQGLTAQFRLDALPPGSFEVVVVARGRAREHRAIIKGKDRERLR